MATTRKILSKGIISTTPVSGEKSAAPKKEAAEKVTKVAEQEVSESGEESRRQSAPRLKKVCQFCSNKTEPHYFDIVALRRFINDRGRIVTRTRSGSCAKHQRRITKEIKRARHLALLPFTVRV
ncbi:MAG: 30S ribosomal protein S18 [Candidatus Daviesbacteria bacterium]|nr:30S ribosomal protein S18 [Candidatus Daviesbacteria bacterium]